MSASDQGSPLYGVLSIALIDDRLKRPALLFDSIHGGIIRFPEETSDSEKIALREKIFSNRIILHEPIHEPEQDSFGKILESFNHTIASVEDMDLMSRIWASSIEERTGVPSLALVHSLGHPSTTPKDMPVKRQDVLRIIFEQLPLPTQETPWDAIIDWRLDEEAKIKYRRLRAWINRVSRQGLSQHEVQDELATLLDDYGRYMEVQHKKMRRSRSEVVVTTVTEFLEGAIRLQLSPALKKLFSLFREEVSLLESELKAPGREVAYINATRERFR